VGEEEEYVTCIRQEMREADYVPEDEYNTYSFAPVSS
jgi:hypothetical protein